MKKYLLLLILPLFMGLSCERDDEADRDSFAYFQLNLRADMSFNDLRQTFGEPDKDIGSGIHIYVYQLKDKTEIWIGYTNGIVYARHMDSNGNVLHHLV